MDTRSSLYRDGSLTQFVLWFPISVFLVCTRVDSVRVRSDWIHFFLFFTFINRSLICPPTFQRTWRAFSCFSFWLMISGCLKKKTHTRDAAFTPTSPQIFFLLNHFYCSLWIILYLILIYYWSNHSIESAQTLWLVSCWKSKHK